LSESIGVVVACHNEARYLDRSLGALVSALSGFDSRLILIADRCTDDSAVIARRYCDEVLLKEKCLWRNSYAENLNMGLSRMIGRDYLSVVDADMVVPNAFYERAVGELRRNRSVCSVSSVLYTEPSSGYNGLYHGYERVMEKLGLTRRYRKHGHRVYRADRLRTLLERRGRIFEDVLAPDSRLDRDLGCGVGVMKLVTLHIRETGLSKSMRSQIRQGRAMREIGASPASVAKEVFRFRPIVSVAYLIGNVRA
jgi:glycosyltransferase involved in cell wall biosynthesis